MLVMPMTLCIIGLISFARAKMEARENPPPETFSPEPPSIEEVPSMQSSPELAFLLGTKKPQISTHKTRISEPDQLEESQEEDILPPPTPQRSETRNRGLPEPPSLAPTRTVKNAVVYRIPPQSREDTIEQSEDSSNETAVIDERDGEVIPQRSAGAQPLATRDPGGLTLAQLIESRLKDVNFTVRLKLPSGKKIKVAGEQWNIEEAEIVLSSEHKSEEETSSTEEETAEQATEEASREMSKDDKDRLENRVED